MNYTLKNSTMDVKQLEGNWPPAQKESPEPKYKNLWFQGELEDDREDFYHYAFNGDYFEFDGVISFVKATVSTTNGTQDEIPIIPQDELQNILRIDIREELNTDYTIIFETKIELK